MPTIPRTRQVAINRLTDLGLTRANANNTVAQLEALGLLWFHVERQTAVADEHAVHTPQERQTRDDAVGAIAKAQISTASGMWTFPSGVETPGPAIRQPLKLCRSNGETVMRGLEQAGFRVVRAERADAGAGREGGHAGAAGTAPPARQAHFAEGGSVAPASQSALRPRWWFERVRSGWRMVWR